MKWSNEVDWNLSYISALALIAFLAISWQKYDETTIDKNDTRNEKKGKSYLLKFSA